jgi:hypothetical protein
MTNTAEHQSQQRIRRYTGMVGLIFVGERPVSVKTGAAILKLANETYFVEEARHVDEHGGRRYEYVPTPHSPDALIEALTQGRLLCRFTVSGARPNNDLLPSGTYYTYVDFVESPEFNEARWIARIINDTGQVVRIIPNVEVKQVISFHPTDSHLTEQHSKPRISSHGIAETEVENALLQASVLGSTGWIHSSSGWSALPGGGGCSETHTCQPAIA